MSLVYGRSRVGLEYVRLDLKRERLVQKSVYFKEKSVPVSRESSVDGMAHANLINLHFYPPLNHRNFSRHVEHTDHAEPEEALTEAEQVMLVSQLYRTRKKGHQKC